MKKSTSTIAICVTLLFSVFAFGCNTASKTATDKPEVEKTDAKAKVIEIKGESIGSGSFTGKSDHVTSGTATIRKTADGNILHLGSDFKFDGAPDPKFAFGKDGVNKETIFVDLKENKGEQSYEIPDSINIEEYNEVWLWCKQFNVPLGMAKLSK